MIILIPHLFPDLRLLEAATHNIKVPALETLLTRGKLQTCPAEGTEAALCSLLGIPRQQDWPIAPITLESDGEAAHGAYWLRADPVHMSVMRDRIVLAGGQIINLSQAESEALARTITEHFGTALHLLPLHPERWYLRYAQPPRLRTTPLSVAAGRDIQLHLPQGEDAPQFRSLLNEIQMLLYDHPVNQARESRGELPVNALWLWGGGVRPHAVDTSGNLFAHEASARALGAFCNLQINQPPSHWTRSSAANMDRIVLDTLTPAGQCGDAYGWRSALISLEELWFAPLLASLGTLGPSGLQLIDPVNGQMLHVTRTDAWKIWRRPKKLASITR
tara:strand:- start:92 stop:1090 length:999 start_codon:yes stop_codon:yes gene_type:complete